MKTFPKQKNSLLTNRFDITRHSQANFEQLLQKQLEDDFKVYQYLNENPNQGHNTQLYIGLFNSLLVRKAGKKRKVGLLKSSLGKFERSAIKEYEVNQSSLSAHHSCPTPSLSPDQGSQSLKLQFQQHHHQLQLKTEQQLQMQRILLKQITENKKSIHLLKGDISHMIQRNQSISVLESKVNKVSLVSDNQLKKVSLALSKDKEQVQLRREMQKKFYNKLKIIQSQQSKTLKKIKQSYIDTMKRRKQIFDNLTLIEKQCASIEQYSDKLKQYKEKNHKTLGLFRLLNFVAEAIDRAEEIQSRFEAREISVKDFCSKVKKVYFGEASASTYRSYCSQSSKKQQQPSLKKSMHKIELTQVDSQASQTLIDQITPQRLQKLIEKLLVRYNDLNQRIQENKKLYNHYMLSIKQNYIKLYELDHKIYEIKMGFNRELEGEICSQIDGFDYHGYFASLGAIGTIYGVINLLAHYFQKNKVFGFGDMDLVTTIHSNHKYHLNLDINQDIQTQNSINLNLFTQLSQALPYCFERIKSKLIVCQIITPKIKQQLQKSIFLTFVQGMRGKKSKNGDDNKDGHGERENQRRNSSDVQNAQIEEIRGAVGQTIIDPGLKDEDRQLAELADVGELGQQGMNKDCQNLEGELYIFNQKQNSSKINNVLNKKMNLQDQNAKRVQLLQRIDQDYYRMIKQTIEMEKQNTKKNYQFQKSFKRNKYSSQDELLQQKRFQATFSNLFKQDREDSNKKSKNQLLESKITRFLSKSIDMKTNKSAFSSLHSQNTKNRPKLMKIISQKNEKMDNNRHKASVLDSTKTSTHSTFWEKQKKIKLSSKLKSILNNV